MTIVSNCGHDEWYKFRYGEAGDQTGDEYQLCNWYYFRQNVVLRYELRDDVPQLMAEYARNAALNDLIGYDQAERETFYYAMLECGYNPAFINYPCETDCSCSDLSIAKVVGIVLGIQALAEIDHSGYTGNMVNILTDAGFTAYYDPEMLVDGLRLKPGDILLNEEEHTNIVVESDNTQMFEIDGLWGRETTRALQRYIKTSIDGEVSHQHPECAQPGFTTGWQYDQSYEGSELIRAIQMWLQSRGLYDAHIDGLCGTQTIKGLQKMTGTTVDGEISAPSDCVREIQRRIVDGSLFK